jgi:hypothetical protein
MRNVLPRLFAGLPDAITAGLFLTAWIAPEMLGTDRIIALMLTMVIEFLVMHSAAFYAMVVGDNEPRMFMRLAMLAALSAFYLLFVLFIAAIMDSMWALGAFAWLVLGRFLHLFAVPTQNRATDAARLRALWVISMLSYFGGMLVVVIVQPPAFGITADVIASLHLSGNAAVVQRPYLVLAFGMLYFGVQAWAKYAFSGTDATAHTVPVNATVRSGELS